jgi:DMSO/TMAO reductase YedYZ molybdopterin-dependent catalytic subunit
MGTTEGQALSDEVIISPDTQRAQRIPPGQRLTKEFPVLHHGTVHHFDLAKWTFRIFGLVEKERTLSYTEFTALPQVKVKADIHCVTTWSRLDNVWEGVAASEIVRLAAVKPEAKHVLVHGHGGFTANLSLDDFLQPDVLFALSHDGIPITPEHGAPVRLVVPRLYFWKSAKWVTGVEFLKDEELGFWEKAGYHERGDPWKEQRYRH